MLSGFFLASSQSTLCHFSLFVSPVFCSILTRSYLCYALSVSKDAKNCVCVCVCVSIKDHLPNVLICPECSWNIPLPCLFQAKRKSHGIFHGLTRTLRT
jgi:hypothetical protein